MNAVNAASKRGPTKQEFARDIIGAGVSICTAFGTEEPVFGKDGSAWVLKGDGLNLVHSTPKTRLPGTAGKYGLDIWVMVNASRTKKVFSAWWQEMTPPEIGGIDLVRLDRGPWIEKLLEIAGALIQGRAIDEVTLPGTPTEGDGKGGSRVL